MVNITSIILIIYAANYCWKVLKNMIFLVVDIKKGPSNTNSLFFFDKNI